MSSNFDFLRANEDSIGFFHAADLLEQDYAMGNYASELTSARKIAENVVRFILDQNYLDNDATFAQNLKTVKYHHLLDQRMVDLLYAIKQRGNEASHTLEQYDKKNGLLALKQVIQLLYWFAKTYCDFDGEIQPFIEPAQRSLYTTSERHMIYSLSGDNSDGNWPRYTGLEKVGETTASQDLENDWTPNSDYLRSEAHHRIDQYMKTSGVPYHLDWVELAHRKVSDTWFDDHDVHRVLLKSGFKRDAAFEKQGAKEWFRVTTDQVKQAITAVKNGRESIDGPVQEIGKIELRPEQQEAVDKTAQTFKTKYKMLWNAKMRFGKTLSALQLIKTENYAKVLIMSHRPVVVDGWQEDFNKIGMQESGYKYGSDRKNGLSLESLQRESKKFVYFASLQDLRESSPFGGKYVKNQVVKDTIWDLVIIDEAHEGTQTDPAQQVLDGVITENYTRKLVLSGTPFNLMDEYTDPSEVFTWDYVMEQQAKYSWDSEHPNGERNPYVELPSVSMYTFEIKNRFKSPEFLDDDKSFNFREFFKVDDETGKFVYADKVNQFLDNISSSDERSNYPFSTQAFRDNLRHTLWLMPNISAAKAMKVALDNHPVFSSYKVINVAGNGNREERDTDSSQSDLDAVNSKITTNPARTRTITLTVRKMTTGVTIKPWTGVLFLSNTNSAMQYLQAAFRAQTPYQDEEFGRKTNCYIFDFAPDRALKVMAASRQMSTGVGKLQTSDQRAKLGELLNFLPIIGEEGQGMRAYQVDTLLTQLKKVYAEKAVQSGFDDDSLYNDELLKMTNVDLNIFKDIKSIVGTTKPIRLPDKIDVNHQGLDDKQYENAIRAEKKPKRERTPEEQADIDRKNALKKQRKSMISVLRGISIRIPMMIYGMDIDIRENVDIDNFIEMVDSKSWSEFMPKGITKEKFRQVSKYYDPFVFVEAGRIIRHRVKELDQLDPIERAQQIADIFSTFKNPDKETVLTPWRAVNMQLGKTIGGYSFFDDDYENSTKNGRSIAEWRTTNLTDEIFNNGAHVLEINSKTGLYLLYVATSLYYRELQKLNDSTAGKFSAQDLDDLWADILERNIFAIAKTPMARSIAIRTISGYKQLSVNVKYISEIVSPDKENTIIRGMDRVREAFPKVKFDIVMGNPPYQKQIGNYKYQLHLDFLRLGYELSDRYVSFIQPLNWLNEKKLLDKMSPHLVSLNRFSDSTKIFPGVSVPSGVGFYLIDKNANVDKTKVTEGKESQNIKITGNLTLDDIRLKKIIHFGTSIASRLSNYKGFSNKDKSLTPDESGEIQIWFKKESGKQGKNSWIRVARSSVPDGDIIDEYKVMVPKDGHAERTESKPENIFNLRAMVLRPGQISTDRPYLIKAKDEEEARLIADYANSKFFRRILHFQDKASSVPKQAFADIPDISEWVNEYRKRHTENIDIFLNSFYHLDDRMIADINRRIAEK